MTQNKSHNRTKHLCFTAKNFFAMGCMNKDIEHFYRELRSHREESFTVYEHSIESIREKENRIRKRREKRKFDPVCDHDDDRRLKKLRTIDVTQMDVTQNIFVVQTDVKELDEREFLEFAERLRKEITERRQNNRIINTLHYEMEY